jgi:hypothetical protein
MATTSQLPPPPQLRVGWVLFIPKHQTPVSHNEGRGRVGWVLVIPKHQTPNHARRFHLEKLLYLELFRSPIGYFKPLQDPSSSFRKRNGRNITVPDLKWL